MGILSFLFGCGSGTPYHKKDGDWFYDNKRMTVTSPGSLTPLNKRFARSSEEGFYRGVGISGSDGKSFEALSDHYAKDKKHVYYCDTYRKGQEYYFYKYSRISTIDSVDAGSFIYLSSEYGKDRLNVFFEGKMIQARDAATFEVMDYGFAKDKVSGYYLREEIKGSDGTSFARLDDHYSKDKNHVYFSDTRIAGNTSPSSPFTVIIENCSPEEFAPLFDGYARSAKKGYYNGRMISNDADSLKALSFGYAKSEKEVFYMGEPIKGADSFSFTTLEIPTEQANAKDKNGEFQQGKRVK